MANWSGQDWALLLGGVSVLLAAIVSAIGTIANLIVSIGTSKKVDGMLVTRDASNVAAGEVIGRQAGDDAAAERDEGRRQEREFNRETVALAPQPNGVPLPVADDRTAVAAEKGAAATERIADAAEKKP